MAYRMFEINVYFDCAGPSEKRQKVLKRITQREVVSNCGCDPKGFCQSVGLLKLFVYAERQASPPNI